MTAIAELREMVRRSLMSGAFADLNTHSSKAPGGIHAEPDGSLTFKHDGQRIRVTVEPIVE